MICEYFGKTLNFCQEMQDDYGLPSQATIWFTKEEYESLNYKPNVVFFDARDFYRKISDYAFDVVEHDVCLKYGFFLDQCRRDFEDRDMSFFALEYAIENYLESNKGRFAYFTIDSIMIRDFVELCWDFGLMKHSTLDDTCSKGVVDVYNRFLSSKYGAVHSSCEEALYHILFNKIVYEGMWEICDALSADELRFMGDTYGNFGIVEFAKLPGQDFDEFMREDSHNPFAEEIIKFYHLVESRRTKEKPLLDPVC